MDMDDAVSLLGDNDNGLDDADQVLMGLSNDLVASFKAPDKGNNSPSRSSTGSFASIDITGSANAATNDKPAISRIAATEEQVELHPRLISNKELGVLSVLRAEGAHFTAAGRAAMANSSLEAIEEGRAGEVIDDDDDEKALGKRAAAGYAAMKSIGGDIAALFGFAQGVVEGSQNAQKTEKTKWEKFCLAVKIVFGWFLLVFAAILTVCKDAVKENPLKSVVLLVVWITMLARGVSFGDILTQSIESYAKKE
ncbi:hypothetical protein CALVIDRAFT_569857 [Calocera viscosa TUFC12733]|uniref:Uncharacterized protein n=1 Tax=Calocera viscosa (strain TUFC12733) TaxID=1330018 RepID=A0A167FI14_CALVF|nr:hypothetical protein CALVIDRAFT_569857 [Calocera viscosa TUFC12733]